MSKLFWFTDDECENIWFDHHGNIRGAIREATKASLEYQSDVYINEGEDIIGTVFYNGGEPYYL